MKRILSLLISLLLIIGLAACQSSRGLENSTAPEISPAPESTSPPAPKAKVNIGVLKGPTGIGSAYLMEKNEKGEALNDYKFVTATAPTDLTGQLVSGELDMAALPTNVAVTLYNKTNGNVQILAINTLGVLYILQNGRQIESVADLRGKTLYATGQGANPEYVLNYILRENGLEPGVDLTIEYKDSEELATLMATGRVVLCMLPVPAATTVLSKNPDVSIALDLTEEWGKVSEGSVLTMGCMVLRKNSELSGETIANFLKEYEESINYVRDNPDEAAELVAKFEIAGSAEIAKAAIPDSNLVFISGDKIKEAIEGYYEVLFKADPASIGGKLPDDGFYYKQ